MLILQTFIAFAAPETNVDSPISHRADSEDSCFVQQMKRLELGSPDYKGDFVANFDFGRLTWQRSGLTFARAMGEDLELACY